MISTVRIRVFDASMMVMAIVAAVVAAYIAISYSGQPLQEAHGFRQTQTALTSYWMLQEGFQLAYQTPVAGSPWSIPFEFPLYQGLVALFHMGTGIDLVASGRLVSFFFLLAILPLVFRICRSMSLPEQVPWLFSTMALSAPLYIFWGRAFLMETTALFLSVLSIAIFVSMWDRLSVWRVLTFLIAMTAALLQKATTALPVLLVLGLPIIARLYKDIREESLFAVIRRGASWILPLSLLFPLLVGILWVAFTDHVKSKNPLGMQLTSTALSSWNWGTPDQRFSSQLWDMVVWQRIFEGNLGGMLGLAILAAGFFVVVGRSRRLVLGLSLVLFLLPLLLFSNLHIIHAYYQTSSVVFLIFSLAMAIHALSTRLGRPWLSVLAVAVVMIMNYRSLAAGYLPLAKKSFGPENREVAIGWTLRRELPASGQFISFGNDWSSSLAFEARRKSFSVPEWFASYNEAALRPEQFLDRGRLAALVACPGGKFRPVDALTFADQRGWKSGVVHGCVIAAPEATPSVEPVSSVPCEGSIEAKSFGVDSGRNIVGIEGWLRPREGFSAMSGRVHLTVLTGTADATLELKAHRHEALQVPTVGTHSSSDSSSGQATGFSRLITLPVTETVRAVEISVSDRGNSKKCRFRVQA